jgi:hypothetical protein
MREPAALSHKEGREMDRILWSRIFLILGLFGMLVGALDPLEGSVIILPSAGFAALGGFIGHSARRKLLYTAFLLIAAGIGAMFLLSAPGVVRWRAAHSSWWILVVLPYPIGWILGVVAVVLSLAESFRHRAATA